MTEDERLHSRVWPSSRLRKEVCVEAQASKGKQGRDGAGTLTASWCPRWIVEVGDENQLCDQPLRGGFTQRRRALAPLLLP